MSSQSTVAEMANSTAATFHLREVMAGGVVFAMTGRMARGSGSLLGFGYGIICSSLRTVGECRYSLAALRIYLYNKTFDK